jgi:hypothetical protein
MVLHVTGSVPAMVNHVRVGEAVDRGLAVTEGEHGRRCRKAERREEREHNRKPKTKTGRERGQHDLGRFFPLPPSLGRWAASRKPREKARKQAQ